MRFATKFKLGADTLKYHLFRKRIPTNIMFSVTDKCQSRCKYCGIPARGREELSIDEIYRLIDETVALGTSRICLWGGEPLIREDIGKIISYCKKKNLMITMDSNGYLVPKRIDEISNLDFLLISFDGEEEIHDLNRENGSYARVIRAFEVACKRLPVWTITVLTKNNLNSIDFILGKAKKYGFFTTWQVLHHQGLGSDESKKMYPNQEEYKNAIRLLIRRKKEGAPIVNSIEYFNYIYDWKDFKRPYSKEKRKGLACYGGKLFCNIDTDGKVYPCSVLVDRVPAKKATKVGLKNAFDHIKDIKCQSCSGGCYVEYNYIYSLNLKVINNWRRYISLSKKQHLSKVMGPH